MAITKPANLDKVIVLNDPVGGDVTFAARKISFTGAPQVAKIDDVVSYQELAYAAGTLEVQTVDYAAVAAADNTVYKLTLKNKATGEAKTYSIITPAAGTTTTTIKDLFETAVINDTASVATSSNSVGGTTQTLTERSLDSKGFIVSGPTGVVVVVTVAHVDAAGTTAIVTVFDPVNVIAARTYETYIIDHDKRLNGNKSAEVLVYIFAATNGPSAGFAAFDAAITDVFTAATTAAATQPYVEII